MTVTGLPDEQAHDRQHLLLKGLELSPFGVALVDGSGRVRHVNAACAALTGRSVEDLEGCLLGDLVAAGDRGIVEAALDRLRRGGSCQPVDVCLSHPSGSGTWISVAAVALDEGDDDGGHDGSTNQLAFVQLVDITERKGAEERLVHRATHDQLTGLPSRLVFLEHLQRALARLARHPVNHVAVLFLDLDGLKEVNDTHGHAAGDELLLAMASRLRRALRPSDVVARLGGDEFTVLLEDIDHPAEAASVAQRVLRELQPPFQLGIGPVLSSASIGIAIGTDAETPADALVANADAAMYRAKERGGGSYDVFDEAAFDTLAQRRRMEVELREALRSGAFRLAYQPIIDLRSGGLAAAEALLRWEHPTLGLLSAAHFIDVAERSGLILPIGRWVLGEACRQLAEWDRELGERAPQRLFVNVGVRELDHEFAARVGMALRTSGVAAERLCIEVTETEILADPEAARNALESLSDLGCSIVVDDFGTGYSSLSRLTELHVDVLKVDTSFVRTMESSRQSSAIVSAILLLAHNLRLDVVAEGIETADQLAVLDEMGCQYGQGYHVSRPIDGESFAVLASGTRPAELVLPGASASAGQPLLR